MPSRKLFTLLLSLTLLLSTSVSLFGQSTYGSVVGSVTDPSGAAIPGATVTLTNIGTQEKRTQSSGADGGFTFVNLFAGQYRVDVEKAGFKHFARTDVSVEVQQSTSVTAALQVGEVARLPSQQAQSGPLAGEGLGHVMAHKSGRAC